MGGGQRRQTEAAGLSAGAQCPAARGGLSRSRLIWNHRQEQNSNVVFIHTITYILFNSQPNTVVGCLPHLVALLLVTCNDNYFKCNRHHSVSLQRLAGATLLVFANKQDLPGALSKEAIREVRLVPTAFF